MRGGGEDQKRKEENWARRKEKRKWDGHEE